VPAWWCGLDAGEAQAEAEASTACSRPQLRMARRRVLALHRVNGETWRRAALCLALQRNFRGRQGPNGARI